MVSGLLETASKAQVVELEEVTIMLAVATLLVKSPGTPGGAAPSAYVIAPNSLIPTPLSPTVGQGTAGGGGSSGGGSGNPGHGGGGGGGGAGAYVYGVFEMRSGETYTIVVGTGANASSGGTGAQGAVAISIAKKLD